MWNSFPPTKLTDAELLNFANRIMGKYLPPNYSQEQIRQYMLMTIHKMLLKFVYTKAGVWFGGRLAFKRLVVIGNRKITCDFLQLIKREGSEIVLEEHFNDDVCDCGNAGIHLFTEAPLHIIYATHNHCLDAKAKEMPQLTEEMQELISQGVSSHTGDLIALHLILIALSLLFRKPIPEEWLALSPLTILTDSEDGSQVLSEDSLSLLFIRNRSFLLSFLDKYLAKGWTSEEIQRRELADQEWTDEPESRDQRQELTRNIMEGYQHTTEVLNSFIEHAENSDNINSLTSLLMFYLEIAQLLPGPEETIDLYREMSIGFTRTSDRDAFLAAVAEFFDVGQRLVDINNRIIGIPFVDKTEKEKVFSTYFHNLFIDYNMPEWLQAVHRACAGIIG